DDDDDDDDDDNNDNDADDNDEGLRSSSCSRETERDKDNNCLLMEQEGWMCTLAGKEYPTMDDNTVSCADGFKAKLEYLLSLLLTFEEMFAHTDVVFDIVQQKAMDVAKNRESDKHNGRAQQDPERMHMRWRRQGTWNVRLTYKVLYDSIQDNIKSQIAQRYKSWDSM
ncbi:unnamed protein product, partial [Coregonus sp. 'balchen']